MADLVRILNFVLPGMHGRPVVLDVFYRNDDTKKPVLIFAHGFKGFKDWGHHNLMAEEFARNGFLFIKFNFSHNGTTVEAPVEIRDKDAFGENNFIIELDDLKCVLDFASSYPQVTEHADCQQIFLIGHSRGGSVAILKAREDGRVKKLVTWAAVKDITTIKKRTIETWENDGVVYAKNSRTGEALPMKYQFYEAVKANRSRLDVLKAARSLNIPWLVVHGDKDEAVDPGDAHILSNAARRSTELIIQGGTHTFGGYHPYTEKQLPPHASSVIAATIAFLKL
jgi:uncharacterized protein